MVVRMCCLPALADALLPNARCGRRRRAARTRRRTMAPAPPCSLGPAARALLCVFLVLVWAARRRAAPCLPPLPPALAQPPARAVCRCGARRRQPAAACAANNSRGWGSLVALLLAVIGVAKSDEVRAPPGGMCYCGGWPPAGAECDAGERQCSPHLLFFHALDLTALDLSALSWCRSWPQVALPLAPSAFGGRAAWTARALRRPTLPQPHGATAHPPAAPPDSVRRGRSGRLATGHLVSGPRWAAGGAGGGRARGQAAAPGARCCGRSRERQQRLASAAAATARSASSMWIPRLTSPPMGWLLDGGSDGSPAAGGAIRPWLGWRHRQRRHPGAQRIARHPGDAGRAEYERGDNTPSSESWPSAPGGVRRGAPSKAPRQQGATSPINRPH
jgi:hypothetical protein